MVIIDTNSLILLILGLIDPTLINKHKRTSIYDEKDFHALLTVIKNLDNVVVLPNIWTEVDNLLNSFKGKYKTLYVESITQTIKTTTEKYIESKTIENKFEFYDLGLTDTLILEFSKECEMLITSDSELSDYAVANDIKVFDLKKWKNERLKNLS
jgi:rRNA-processing protein FCF1